ncbi:MAG: copper-binding protein [Candidatus Rokubacteria bacterium]|nr:copper-binding protein [Candidatus Rokubacteria bacterium]
MIRWVGCGLLLGALLVSSPASALEPGQGAVPKPDYRGTGVVLALLPPPSDLHASRPVIIIHHDPILPLMNEEMSMPFLAASTELFRGLKPGDRIAFDLLVTDDALLVIAVKRLGAGR